MDSNKFLAKEKKVAGTTKVKVIKIDYLDPEYKIEEFFNRRSTNTGLVEVAKLFPQNPNLPTFLFRWDEKEDVVDVDICKNGQRRNKLWREKGYEGHRPQKTIGEGRIFEADISISNKKIFRGKIDVGLFMTQRISVCLKPIATLALKVIRKN